MWEYTDKVRDYFLNPRNVGEMKDADAVGEAGSLACGDALKLYLKVRDGVIDDTSFLTFGCASAIASSSALTEMIKGKTLEEALSVTNNDIAQYLGGLPKEKMHCSVMGREALEAAIRAYRGEAALPEGSEGRIVCKCFGVTEEQIIRAVRENKLTTAEDVTNFTKAGGGCGECLQEIESVIADVLAGKSGDAGKPGQAAGAAAPAGLEDWRKSKTAGAAPLSNVQRMQRVMNVLDEIIRPRLRQDGGDIELVDIDGKTVSVALRGTCTSCPSSRLTIEGFVQQTLREQVEADIVVREAVS
ncbi:MAG: Fe-S cluster assembly protein NifU [Desulfovibrio sp.]|jgi:NifU-like protein|nr:Fe-S cluster assembly protein NifU [Desulfovibrio sp.]